MLINIPADLVDDVLLSVEDRNWELEQSVLMGIQEIVSETVKLAEEQAYG